MRAFTIAVLVGVFVAARPAIARADSGDPYNAGTIALQSGGGFVGGVLGGVILGGGMYGLTHAIAPKRGDIQAVGVVLGAIVGIGAGGVVSVKLIGDGLDGTGSWGATSLGMVSSGLVVAGGIALAEKFDAVPIRARFVGGILILTAGPVLGYQLSNDGPSTSTERRFMVSLPVASF